MKNKYVLPTGGTGKRELGVTPIVLARGAIITVPSRNLEEAEDSFPKGNMTILESLTPSKVAYWSFFKSCPE